MALNGFPDIERLVKDEVRRKFKSVGANAVAHAVEHGNYTDRTGRLRRSNRYRATDEELVIENTAPYASEVESRGYDVTASAVLNAKKELGL